MKREIDNRKTNRDISATEFVEEGFIKCKYDIESNFQLKVRSKYERIQHLSGVPENSYFR